MISESRANTQDLERRLKDVLMDKLPKNIEDEN